MQRAESSSDTTGQQDYLGRQTITIRTTLTMRALAISHPMQSMGRVTRLRPSSIKGPKDPIDSIVVAEDREEAI